MSYADVAASGPTQSPEEARAQPVPSIKPDDSEANTLIDVDTPHVSTVKSDFEEQAVQTETHATRLEQEAEAETRAAAAKAEEKASEAKKRAATAAKDAKKTVKKDAQKIADNTDNPVFIGNVILWGITIAAVGYAAYQKNSRGELDTKTVGTVALGLGVLGAADWFVSKKLVEEKYPPRS